MHMPAKCYAWSTIDMLVRRLGRRLGEGEKLTRSDEEIPSRAPPCSRRHQQVQLPLLAVPTPTWHAKQGAIRRSRQVSTQPRPLQTLFPCRHVQLRSYHAGPQRRDDACADSGCFRLRFNPGVRTIGDRPRPSRTVAPTVTGRTRVCCTGLSSLCRRQASTDDEFTAGTQ